MNETSLSLCILNGYPQASRDNFDLQGVGHPHTLYRDFFVRTIPNVNIDVLFIADPGAILPEGTDLTSYDGYIWTGSDLTIYHLDDQRVTRQIELARAIFHAGVPSYGSCWGIQMAAVAAGLIFLATLLFAIVSSGMGAFQQTYINVPVYLDRFLARPAVRRAVNIPPRD